MESVYILGRGGGGGRSGGGTERERERENDGGLILNMKCCVSIFILNM